MSKTRKLFDSRISNESSTLFDLLSPEEDEFLKEHTTISTYGKGEPIFKQGTFVTNVSFIKTGMAKISIEDDNGMKLILRLATPGAPLGIQNLYTDKLYQFSAIAIENSIIFQIEKDAFLSIINNNALFSAKVIELLSLDSLFVYNKSLSFYSKQINARLAISLLYLSKEVYGKKKFKLTLSRQDLAELTGVTKETVTRTLADFDSEGIVSVKAKEIEILNPKALQQKIIDNPGL